LTASGQRFDMYQLTAAHRTLPLGTRVRVTNLRNGRAVVVTITDRGPFLDGRVIDLSYAAAKRIGMTDPGTAPVRLVVLR
jgi:rare lipoprotein A